MNPRRTLTPRQAAAIGALLAIIILLGLADLAAWALTGLPILAVW